MTIPRIDSQTLASLNFTRSPTDLAARLGQAVRLRQGPNPGLASVSSGNGINRPMDKVDFTSLDESLQRFGPLLRGIKATAARNVGASTEAFNAAIQKAVGSFAADASGAYPNGVSGDWNPDLVLGSSVFSKGLGLAETLDIELSTHGLDDQAGVFLDLGTNVNEADPKSASTLRFGGLELEVAGNLGATTLSFSSGQTLGQIAAAINSVSGETGAVASVQSAVGLVLRSTGIGRDSFVTVNVIDPGTADTSEVYFGGVFGPDDEPRESYRFSWDTSSEITDYGSELSVYFNGNKAERVGDYWTATLDGVEVAFDLDEAAINQRSLNNYGMGFIADLGTLRSTDVRQQPDGTITDFDRQFVMDSLVAPPGLEPGDSLDLDFAFQGEPDAAGVFLDFGANIVGGYLSQSTTFEIGGPDGNSSLSFTSGMTISQIVAVINSQASMTGVRVESYTSGVGIVLRSSNSNPGAFVSVTTIPYGDGAPGDARPVFTAYEVQGSGKDAAIVGEGTALADGVAYRDEARELTAKINGQLAQFANGYWSVHLDSGVDITINVDVDAIIAAGGSVSLGSLSKPPDGVLGPVDRSGPGLPRSGPGISRPSPLFDLAGPDGRQPPNLLQRRLDLEA